ncbi:protein kinase [Myxococcota bacterium]|nr:protein kinase [Myxococcota bacterium]
MHGKDDGSRRFGASGPSSPAATPASPIEADESTTPARAVKGARAREDAGRNESSRAESSRAESSRAELRGERRSETSRAGAASDEDVLDAFSEEVELSDSRQRRRSGNESVAMDPDVIAIESVSSAALDRAERDAREWSDDLRQGSGERARMRPPPLPHAGPAPHDDPHASLPPVAVNDPRIGETLNGRYKLEKLIGKGGMGRVYRAIQSPLNRPVALKILNPEFQKKDPQFVRRFYLEAATAARLTHPNTITVFDYGEAESGELFIVMEYLRGRPLSRVISNEGPLSAERTMHIALQICRALREAHSKGIIHRDLKPGNILLLEEGDDADFVKVLDFGLVKLFTPPAEEGSVRDSSEPLTPGPQVEGELTRAGMFLGSPKYMSPEQIQGQHLDPRTDIYSLGVLMFQMLAGKPPYGGSTSVEVIYKHVNHPVPRVADVVPGLVVPEELEHIIRTCLAKSPEDRFPSMGELLVRLKDVRRLITGVSAASEIGVSLQSLMADQAAGGSGSRPSIIPSSSLDASGARSQRPRTSDAGGTGSISISRATISQASTSQSQRPRSSAPQAAATLPEPVKAISREAAFTELGDDDTPSALVRQRQQARDGGGSLAKVAPIVAGGALVLVLGVAAYVLSSSPPPPAATPEKIADDAPPEPVAKPVPSDSVDVRVAFSSTPSGAEIIAEDGAKLGTTPTSYVVRVKKGESPTRRFTFRRAGFLDELVEERIEGDAPEVHAILRADPAAGGGTGTKPEKRTPKPGDTDYKENPY